MADSRRRLQIRLTGEGVRQGRVPVQLFARKLQCLQESILQIALGKQSRERDISRGGRRPAFLERQCELFLVETVPGSFLARLELAPPEPTLFEGIPDLGEAALADLRRTLGAIEAQDAGVLESVLPDPSLRRIVLRTVANVLHAKGDDYAVELAIGDTPPIAGLVRPGRELLSQLAGPAPVSAKPSREIQLALIHARCLARFDEAGKPAIQEIIDWDFVDSHPYRPAQVGWGERRFVLQHELACAVTVEGNAWTVIYEPLHIYATGESREGALQEFAEEFASLWDMYASAPDDQLTQDAIMLKSRLRALVSEVKDAR